jgi:hypothetical protein
MVISLVVGVKRFFGKNFIFSLRTPPFQGLFRDIEGDDGNACQGHQRRGHDAKPQG